MYEKKMAHKKRLNLQTNYKRFITNNENKANNRIFNAV